MVSARRARRKQLVAIAKLARILFNNTRRPVISMSDIAAESVGNSGLEHDETKLL
jgi:hypothetical protein